jgi:AcrR family transcriptional regulator
VQFRRRGYARVSLDAIAAAAHVTKRTLYYHFRSKDDLLEAVLEAQHELTLTAFRTFGDRLSGTAEEIMQAMFDDIAVWSMRTDFAGTGFTRFVIELADLPGHPARVIARRHKALLETQLADVLKRAKVPLAERRARELMLLSEGAVVMLLIIATVAMSLRRPKSQSSLSSSGAARQGGAHRSRELAGTGRCYCSIDR